MAMDERIQRLIQAFATDGYDVAPNAGVRVYEGNIGIAAAHRTATIGTIRGFWPRITSLKSADCQQR